MYGRLVRPRHERHGLQSDSLPFIAEMCPRDIYHCLCGNEEEEEPGNFDQYCPRAKQYGLVCPLSRSAITFHRYTCLDCRNKAKDEGRDIPPPTFISCPPPESRPSYSPATPQRIMPKASVRSQMPAQQSYSSSGQSSQTLDTLAEAVCSSVSGYQHRGAVDQFPQIPVGLPTRYPSELPQAGSQVQRGKTSAVAPTSHYQLGSIATTPVPIPFNLPTQYPSQLARQTHYSDEVMTGANFEVSSQPASPATHTEEVLSPVKFDFSTQHAVDREGPIQYINPAKLQQSTTEPMPTSVPLQLHHSAQGPTRLSPNAPPRPQSHGTSALLRGPYDSESSRDYVGYCWRSGASVSVAQAWYEYCVRTRDIITRRPPG